MYSAEQKVVQDTPNLAFGPTVLTARSALTTAQTAFRAHWPEYVMEAALLGAFMVSACLFGVLYEFPNSPVHQAIGSTLIRRMLMGVSMGLTAIALIYSPWGRQSGAHVNPSVTFTFFRLGKIKPFDTLFYMGAQFLGSTLGVLLAGLFFMRELADPNVRYVVTVPGKYGLLTAFIAEVVITFVLMTVILRASNHPRLGSYTGMFAGLLVAIFISFEAPFSGMSMNPARTFGSGFSAGVWTGFWIYLTAPLLGMLAAAEVYTRRNGLVKCCKLYHENATRCIFCGANGGFAS